ncbi:MAG: protein-L-isoaspartate O-methyltransferase [Sandarakinorhabdus sp.]|nr:protein-L-isoaspartate O-methyltransferase [Sandarakinorhabdus sp.]
MIDSQLRTVGVTDESVLAAMNTVPRENFVPQALAGVAYADAALEVAPGRWLLEPMVLALLLQNVGIKAGDRVLVVGAATGYSAAVAAQIGADVIALESDPQLAGAATAADVKTAIGPLPDGWAAGAPYDVVMFEGAIETVPPAFAAQLAPGGRLAAVVRQSGVGGAMAGLLVGGSKIGGLPFLEVAAKPLPGFAALREFSF